MPEQIVEDLIQSIRVTFYSELSEKRFFWERSMLLRAITHPARILETKGALLPWDEYQGVLLKIIGTIKVHGATGAIRSPGRYLLQAVQSHMRIHWEEYYDRAKALRGKVAATMAGLPTRDSAIADQTVEALANLNRVVSAGGGRKKKVTAGIQQELF